MMTIKNYIVYIPIDKINEAGVHSELIAVLQRYLDQSLYLCLHPILPFM